MFEKVVIGNITLYRGDCMEFLAKCKDKEYDLAVVDPPYGIDINMNMGRRKNEVATHAKKTWDSSAPPPSIF